MALVSLPDELFGVLVENSETGRLELPKDATEEQKTVYAKHLKRVERAQKNMVIIEE